MIEAFLRDKYHLLPDSLRRAILVRRRAPIWLAAKIVFIHVPKAAGTSINQALYDRFMGHVRATDIQRWAPRAIRALPSFAITRNPWERLVSAYRFATRGHGVGGYQAGVWRPQQYRIPEFESFETFVKDWLAELDVAALDPIFQPQHLFICDENRRVLVDHVGQLEDLGPTFEFIRDHTGSPPSLERSNLSGVPVDYEQFYTPELTRVVARIYREDIELFGYDASADVA
jgi:hypothetical protein